MPSEYCYERENCCGCESEPICPSADSHGETDLENLQNELAERQRKRESRLRALQSQGMPKESAEAWLDAETMQSPEQPRQESEWPHPFDGRSIETWRDIGKLRRREGLI